MKNPSFLELILVFLNFTTYKRIFYQIILTQYQIEGPGQEEGNQKNSSYVARWEVDGEIKAVQPLILGGNLREKSFIYVTHKGELGIQDIREKNLSVKFNLGKERGMISTMLASAMDQYDQI